MRQVWALFKKELSNYFVSPVAYVVLAVFSVLTAFFFYAMTAEFLSYSLRTESYHIKGMIQTPNVNEMIIRPLVSTYGFICVIMLPMVSMRLLSEENRQGTIQLLLTSPLTSGQIVLGKYLASLAVYMVMLLVTLFYQIFLFTYSSPDWQPVAIGYLGLLLVGAAFLSIGMLMSSLTRNQIVAVVLTFGALLFFWVISWMGENVSPAVKRLLEYISIYNHHQDMAKGVLDTSDLLYYASVIFIGLFATQKVVAAYRWR